MKIFIVGFDSTGVEIGHIKEVVTFGYAQCYAFVDGAVTA